ncbi:N-acetylmuramoyl-L-alanine amidase [Pediococcus stilesii]|uniref:N-acetylmuramoyl-L-alanine amidase n=1 Tax=Pediococcus stilesii TaxID=331679 RepID=A0A0R2L2I8_9LACO|nr:N-acetylmuramoyl-L-alanine amidase [Pediococcus stilesii]KRN94085.1 N-acetylmuramoyl-L-alanine amidase [Pediococcus stilesii]
MNKEIILNFIKRNVIQIIISIAFIIIAVALVTPLFNSKKVYVGLDQVAIRSSASRTSKKIGVLDQYQSVSVLSETNNWYRIRYDDSKIGWIPSWITNRSFAKGQKQTPLSESIIVIDPGHGGTDSGALGIDQSHEEKNYTLKTSKAIETKLDQAGAKVIMTRNNDSFVDLAPRPQIANKSNADAFISIHYDSSNTNNSGTGDTTYYYHDNGSIQLAQAINKQLINYIPLYNRGVKFANYQVLRDNKRPAILIEGGYINTDSDFKVLSSSSYPKKVSTAVYKGLTNFLTNN